MSANCAPHLSQLVCMATPNPIKVEKTALKAKFVVASTALVAEARCLLDDKEELWEKKVMWMRRWEERTGEVYPIVEHRQELGIDTKIDAVDGPAITEADEAYERWVAKEIAHGKADEDMWMGEEAAQAVGEQGASVAVLVVTEKMSHVEVVAQPVRKTIAESEDEDKPKINVPPGPTSRMCNGCTWMKQRCKKSTKAAGKRAQAGTSVAQASKTVKAGPSKRTVDNNNDDDKLEVVESHACVKGKAPVRIAEAAELQATYLCLQVHVDQLTEALEKIGVE
ncbi:hypothetical protein M404DRAFT_19816 [Pisolithus tinctorius Marx 270]|uniref:Uncharacterized protein n=1 Tax=Pisolithus tinctorius Marx 270 TaxID=870435 RepID=A0A0C3JS56_PISTI|nr:hypothetical protein M404DRAFT_19816 [Pisolithus tinctorius Marx 270]